MCRRLKPARVLLVRYPGLAPWAHFTAAPAGLGLQQRTALLPASILERCSDTGSSALGSLRRRRFAVRVCVIRSVMTENRFSHNSSARRHLFLADPCASLKSAAALDVWLLCRPTGLGHPALRLRLRAGLS